MKGRERYTITKSEGLVMIGIMVATLVVVLLLLLAFFAIAKPAHAAPAKAPIQLLTTVWIKAHTQDAKLMLSTVDARPFKHVTVAQIAKGIKLNDGGRVLAFKGNAVLEFEDPHAQQFRISDLVILTKGKNIKSAHISLGIFDGDDWQHPYESVVCSSPSWSIEQCIAVWQVGATC